MLPQSATLARRRRTMKVETNIIRDIGKWPSQFTATPPRCTTNGGEQGASELTKPKQGSGDSQWDRLRRCRSLASYDGHSAPSDGARKIVEFASYLCRGSQSQEGENSMEETSMFPFDAGGLPSCSLHGALDAHFSGLVVFPWSCVEQHCLLLRRRSVQARHVT